MRWALCAFIWVSENREENAPEFFVPGASDLRRGRGGPAFEAFEEPDAGDMEVAVNGGFRDLLDFRGLFRGTAEEVAEFDQADLAGIEDGEFVEGLEEFEDVVTVERDPLQLIVKGDVLDIAPALAGLAGARIVDQDKTHELNGEGVEVLAVG